LRPETVSFLRVFSENSRNTASGIIVLAILTIQKKLFSLLNIIFHLL
jgi:hypothetical protein